MVENRRRQIIRNLSPEVTEDKGVIDAQNKDIEPDQVTKDEHLEEDYVPYHSDENLLEKRVYLPLPVIILGFVTLIFITVTSTYVAMKWPTTGLEFGENPELARFEAAAKPGTLPEKTFQSKPALAVNAPVSNLGIMNENVSRFAALQQNQVPNNLRRTFTHKPITKINLPVVNLNPPSHLLEISGTNVSAQTLALARPNTRPKALGVEAPIIDIAATLPMAETPITKNTALSLASAKELELPTIQGIEAPITILVLTTRTPGDINAVAQTTPQKLMRQRYAKAVVSPVMEAGGNPLLLPVTGTGLPIKTAKLEGVTGVAAPVANIAPGKITNYTQVQPAKSLAIKEFALRTTPALADPVVDMTLAERPVKTPSAAAISAGLETKDYQIRNTSNLKDPVVDLVLPERQIDFTRELDRNTGLETKDITLTEAFGLDSPAALLNLPVRRANAINNKLDVPGQKLMQRRYAKAVTNPEQMEFIAPPSPVPIQPLPDNSLGNMDPWQRFAAAVPNNIEGKGRIVIIIDDMGNNSNMSRALGDLEGPLNFAFLPYAPNLQSQTSNLRNQGHELLVHMPMEPMGNETPGPNALLTSLSDEELLVAIDWNLTQFEGFVGVNNHMGSRFTRDSARMKLVMEELQKRGLLFLDSRTAPNSEGAKWAKRLRMPWAGRDIFLDNEVNEAAILGQLKKVEDMAQSRGTVIAIGHPHGATFRALQTWLPTLEGKGLVLVPLSSIVEFEGQSKLANADPN